MLVYRDEEFEKATPFESGLHRAETVEESESFNYGFLVPENLSEARMIIGLIIGDFKIACITADKSSIYNSTRKRERLADYIYKASNAKSKKEMKKLLHVFIRDSVFEESLFMGLYSWLEEESEEKS